MHRRLLGIALIIGLGCLGLVEASGWVICVRADGTARLEQAIAGECEPCDATPHDAHEDEAPHDDHEHDVDELCCPVDDGDCDDRKLTTAPAIIAKRSLVTVAAFVAPTPLTAYLSPPAGCGCDARKPRWYIAPSREPPPEMRGVVLLI